MKLKKLAYATLACAAVFGMASCSNSVTPTGNNNTTTANNNNGGDNGGDNGNGGEEQKAKSYTYNLATTTLPTNWNPHTYETATDAIILDYSSDGFYTFDYNDKKDGYKIVPAMATGEPTDVTAKYAEKFGFDEDDSCMAWSIPLRSDLKWSTGESITAADFVKSAELLLNPAAQNYRADTLYSGELEIQNAKSYLYTGQHAYATNMVSADYGDDEYVATEDFQTKDGVYYINIEDDSDIAVNINDGGNWASYGLSKYAKAGYFDVDDEGTVAECYTKFAALADEKGYVQITTTTLSYIQDCIAILHGYANAAAYAANEGDYAYIEWEEMAYIGATYGDLPFSDVGIYADGNNLEIVLTKPLSGFYLLYNLTGSWLVNETLYKANESTTDGVYSNTYGTSVDTFASYGPYKLTTFQTDKMFKLEKNENWYGYNDAANAKLYQTTAIVYQLVAEDSTRLQMFEKGELDSYGLGANDVAEYGNSNYLYYTEGASTFFIAMNPDYDKLEANQEAASSAGNEINKTILTVKEFRQALSFAVDRKKFCLACDPTGMAATGVFNNLIIANPETGTTYRSYEASKDVLLDFWGLTDLVGEDEDDLYPTKDEAIESITGVDLSQAKVKFNQAYEYAIANGLMTADAKISITIGLPSTANFYTKGYDFLTNCWTDAVKGTKLEGKLVFTKDDTIANNFANSLKSCQVDVLFGVGWTGSALNPYNLVYAYTDPSYQYDPSIDYSQEMLTIHFDEITDASGVTYEDITLTSNALYWSKYCLAGNEIPCSVTSDDPDAPKTIKVACGSDYDLDTRCAILNAVEACILQQYTLLPLDDEASSSLKGMKVEFYTEEYIYGVGRGGVKYMTYNYDDEAWAAFVKEKNNFLDYANAE